jgi:putative membrane protein
VEIDVAGYGGTPGSEEQQTSALVPVADERTADALIRQVVPAASLSALDEVTLTPAPPRARWLAPLRYRRLAAGATSQLLVCRTGWLTPQHDVVVHARVQSVRYTQGPLQRRLGLASVHADLAGGHGSAAAEHQDAAAALRLVDELVALARANRTPVRRG